MSWRDRFGPGLLVTAAFIGPGTITTASAAGAGFGFALLWALVFSVLATAVLQEMAARLGLVTREGLAQAMRSTFSNPWLGKGSVLLVVAAIGFGNAAYEAGNIAGAALAANNAIGLNPAIASIATGVLAAALLYSGRYGVLEKALIALVLVMCVVFLLTAFMVRPSITDMVQAVLRPSLPAGGAMMALGLIGTTVVPYNLFLHANAVCEKWGPEVPARRAIRESRWDTGVSVGIGGLITLSILSTAAAAFFQTGVAFSGESMALQLEPLLGASARYIFAAGLLASGLTSAITAPLAAAYAVCGALGWGTQLKDTRFRLVWLTVLLCGTVFAAVGTRPLAAILFAQVANGFLLPIVAVFLLVVMNRRDLLADHCNGAVANLLGGAVVLVALGLGLTKVLSVAGLL